MMLFFRVQVNSIARAELVPPLCQVHKVDLIPVLDMVPLAPPPNLLSSQQRTFFLLFSFRLCICIDAREY